jgi:hypothetical protein
MFVVGRVIPGLKSETWGTRICSFQRSEALTFVGFEA